MGIIYNTTPVCVSFVRRNTYIGKIKSLELRTYGNKVFPVIDLLHIKHIRRNGDMR